MVAKQYGNIRFNNHVLVVVTYKLFLALTYRITRSCNMLSLGARRCITRNVFKISIYN